MEEVVEHYRVEVKCANCGFEDSIEIPKGTPVEEAECPECICPTLQKKKTETT